MDLIELLGRLNASHGPSGDEEGIREEIARLAAPYADEIGTDTLGNLIIRKKGVGPRVMVSAHMDSIGFVVTRIEENGFIRIGRIGGVSAKEVVYSPVRFKNGVRGAVVKEEKAEFASLKQDHLLLDIGASSREEAGGLVSLGDTAVFEGNPFLVGEDKVISPYMDNRISCAILLETLFNIKEPSCNLHFVFSAQEEVGMRGARTAAYAIEPDVGIAVDVTDCDDVPGSDRNGTTKLGKGAAVKVMDRSVLCHRQVIKLLEQTAQSLSLSTQRDIMTAGGTDAGAIHTARGGVYTGGLSVPCRYIHTPVEMIHRRDAQDCVSILTQLAHSFQGFTSSLMAE